jgi:predicted amidohydrolase
MAQGEQIHISTWPAIWPTRIPASLSTEAAHGTTRDQPSAPTKPEAANYDNVTANRTRASAHCFETKCFGVLCSGVLGADAIDAIASGSPQLVQVLEQSQRGVTMFLDPTGAPMQGFTVDEHTLTRESADFLQATEGILYADLDVEDCIEGKQYHDVVGGYQRMDVFDLKVDRTRRYPITFTEDVSEPKGENA